MRLLKKSSGWMLLVGAIVLIASPSLTKTLVTIASRELGQPDFISNAPNTPDATSEAHPVGAAIDRGVSPNRLYIADTNNNRVLVYTSVATLATGAPAALVVGQPNLVSN